MKNVARKIAGLMLTLFIVNSVTGACTEVFANNYEDWRKEFKFTNQMLYTQAREKKDISKAYMKCTDISNEKASFTAHVIGTNKTTKTGTDCSRGNTYNFKKGTYHYMKSWVYENGYKYARIGASPNYSYTFTAETLWSPDNYNKY